MTRIIRVFPRRTSMTPTDPLVFAGPEAWPPLFRPEADEVHVSVCFTWDIERGYALKRAWQDFFPVVHIGGPAIDGLAGEFVPGRYIRHGITFTSRGCNRNCPFCLVSGREGQLKPRDSFAPGWQIQDNNFLMCPPEHRERVYSMLKTQPRAAWFTGGLDARLVNMAVSDELRGLRIAYVFLAADTKQSLGMLARAAEHLKWLRRDQRRCYVLLAYDGETIPEAQERLEEVWRIGCVPFAQLYQPTSRWIIYPDEWKQLARTWSRPAAMAAMHTGGV